MTEFKRYCNTCGRDITGKNKAYLNDLDDEHCYCSYICMINDIPLSCVAAKELGNSGTKCSSCGKKLTGNDVVYLNELDVSNDYCSDYCMIKDLPWEID